MMYELPSWLTNQPQIEALKRAAQQWWLLVETWLLWPTQQNDAQTCHAHILGLLAWQRDITPFKGEPEWLYRKRVKYAAVNAMDAGSIEGLVQILQRLGVGDVSVEERRSGHDWDIIQVRVTDSQLSEHTDLLDVVLQHYGRTCRRYRFAIETPFTLNLRVAEYGHEQTHCKAIA